jgi:hypothetical protein
MSCLGERPRPTPTPAPRGLHGILVEAFTGERYALQQLRLMQRAQVWTAVTDTEGRFRFGELPAGTFRLHWSSPGEQWTPVQRVDGGSAGAEIPDDGGVVDIGRVFVRDSTRAQEAFGTFCETEDIGESLPATDLLVFVERGDGWIFSEARTSKTRREWAPPWHAVLCVRSSQTPVGTYTTGKVAYRTTWRVRLIRAEDRKLFRATMSEEPPLQANGRSDVAGDPTRTLLRWLRSDAITR